MVIRSIEDDYKIIVPRSSVIPFPGIFGAAFHPRTFCKLRKVSQNVSPFTLFCCACEEKKQPTSWLHEDLIQTLKMKRTSE
jgi:hypothetical protein